ncbi:MAG: hypothetical protein WBA17_15480 [Saprospiraceae bacterium]
MSKYTPLFFVIPLFLISCTNEEKIVTNTTERIPVYVNLTVTRDSEPEPRQFYYEPNAGRNGDELIWAVEYQNRNADANKFNYRFGRVVNRPDFYFDDQVFRLDFFASEQPRTLIELENYFSEGRSFDFGSAEGQVAVGLALNDTVRIEQLSSSTIWPNSQGELTITSSESLGFEHYRQSYPILEYRQVEGLLIKAEINGEIGIWDFDTFIAQQPSLGRDYIAEEVARIEGEVVFFLRTQD